MQAPAHQPLTTNLIYQGFQWQPETYEHRNEAGGDAGKVPPMIVEDLEAPPSTGTSKLRLLLGVG